MESLGAHILTWVRPLLFVQYSRDQFLRSLQSVIDSTLTDVERLFRERSKLMCYDMESIGAIQSSISAFKKVISVERAGAEGGIHVSTPGQSTLAVESISYPMNIPYYCQVLHHTSAGKVVPSKIWFSPEDRYFHISPEATSLFSISKSEMVMST